MDKQPTIHTSTSHPTPTFSDGYQVVGTWAPGRISYWKKLPAEDTST